MARNRSAIGTAIAGTAAWDNAFNQGFQDGYSGKPLNYQEARSANPQSGAYITGWKSGDAAAHGGKLPAGAGTLIPDTPDATRPFSETKIGQNADAGGVGGGIGGLSGVGGIQSDLNAVGGVSKAISGVNDFLKFVAWLFHPLSILRTVEFIAGLYFFTTGLRAAFNLNRGGGPAADVRRVARELASATPAGAARRRLYGRRQGRREGQVEHARLAARKESRQREAAREQKRGQRRREDT